MPVESIFLLVGTNILPVDASNNENAGIGEIDCEGLFVLQSVTRQITCAIIILSCLKGED